MKRIATFEIDDKFRSILDHTAANPEASLFYGMELKGPHVYLVKDEGIYVMSASKNPQLVEPGKPRRIVAYANEANPNTMSRDDLWEAQQRIAGGDDCSEPLTLDTFKSLVDRGAKQIRITYADDSLNIQGVF